METARDAQAAGAVIIDTRDPDTFGRGHISGSVNVGLGGRYAEFVGSVVASDTDILLVSEPGTETEAKVRLGRIGFDRVSGFIPEPTTTMIEQPHQTQAASRLTVMQLNERRDKVVGLRVVDVRNPGEHASGTIANSHNIPVAQLANRMSELDPDRPTVVFCAGGCRSSIAASLLGANGFTDVSGLLGGYGAWADNEERSAP